MNYWGKFSNFDGILAKTFDFVLMTHLKMIPSDKELNSASNMIGFAISINSWVDLEMNY